MKRTHEQKQFLTIKIALIVIAVVVLVLMYLKIGLK